MQPPRPFEGLTPSDISKILEAALSSGASFAEFFIERRVVRHLKYEEASLRSVSGAVETGAGIRAVAGDGTGYAYTSDPSPEALRRAAAGAGRIAAGWRRGRAFEAGGADTCGPIRISDEDPGAFLPSEIDSRAAYLAEVDGSARRADPRVSEVSASLSEEARSIRIVNSLGRSAAEEQLLTGAGITAYVRSADGAVWKGRHGAGARRSFSALVGGDLEPRALAAEAVRRALVLVDSEEAPAGELPVVIGNGWGGVLLHEAIGHGFEADFVRRGTSVFTGRLGETVAAPLCTVVDDGSLPGRRGSFAVDDEGTVSRRTVLIERGVLKGYLHDLLSANALGMPPTGNGRRESFRRPPIPRQSNLFMEPGEESVEEIVRSVPRGLYAKGIGGGQVDIVNGNFVFEVTEGYLIEDGRITVPVRGANLIGSGQEVLKRITRVGADFALDPGVGTCGKDGQSQPVGVGQPTVLVSALTVGGTRL